MAVQDIPRREGPFVGDGEARAYPFPFLVFKETDVRVVRSVSEEDDAGEEELSLGTDYTVSLNEDQETSPGGTVRLMTPLPVGIRLSIVSAVEATQEVVLTNHDGFYPEILNDAFDKLTVLVQELQEQTGRNLQVPVTSEKSPSELLSDVMSAKVSADKVIPHIPSIETAAGSIDKITTVAENVDAILASEGNAESAKESAELAKENADRAEAAAEAAVVQLHAVSYEAQDLKQAERLQAKANIGADYFVNAKDFGAKGDGATDDTPAFKAALERSNSGVFVPCGEYCASVKDLDTSRLSGPGVIRTPNYQCFSPNGASITEAYVVEELLGYPFFGFNNGVSSDEIFNHAGRAPQGLAYAKTKDGKEHLFISVVSSC